VPYWTTWSPPLATLIVLITAGRHMAVNVMIGTIFALAPRPMPNADRKLCQHSARTICSRPIRSPS
jgi:hypothetical protein